MTTPQAPDPFGAPTGPPAAPSPPPNPGPPYAPPGGYGPPPGSYAPPPGYAPPGYAPPPGMAYPVPAYGYAPAGPRPNGFAIAALVMGILPFTCVGPVLAIVFGAVARQQISASGGLQTGRGMATAGIVLGIVWIALVVVAIVLGAISDANYNSLAHLGPLASVLH